MFSDVCRRSALLSVWVHVAFELLFVFVLIKAQLAAAACE